MVEAVEIVVKYPPPQQCEEGSSCKPDCATNPSGCGCPPCNSGGTRSAFMANTGMNPTSRITDYLDNVSTLMNLLNSSNVDYYVIGSAALAATAPDSSIADLFKVGDFDIVIERDHLSRFYNLINNSFYLDIITVFSMNLTTTNSPELTLISKTNPNAPYYDPITIPIHLSDTI